MSKFKKLQTFSLNGETLQITPVGDSRTGDSLVIGVNPAKLSGTWNVEGRFLNANDDYEAVVGDSIAQSMYSPDSSMKITQSNPLVEGISFENTTFNIVGVCVDPINNGFVTYVPIQDT